MKKIIILLVTISFILCGCGTMKTGEKKEKEAQKITCAVKDEFMKDDDTFLIDVRSEDEYKEKHLKDAINIPLDNIVKDVDENVDMNTSTKIIVYCKSGKRSSEAGKLLIEGGYKNVFDLGAMSNCD